MNIEWLFNFFDYRFHYKQQHNYKKKHFPRNSGEPVYIVNDIKNYQI